MITDKGAQAGPDTTTRTRGRRDLLLSMMVRGSATPLAFVANVLIARLLGPANFGSYMTLLSVGLIAGGIAGFGVAPLLTREIPKVPHEGRSRMVVVAGRWALGLTTRVSLVVIVISAAWFALVPGVMSGQWLGKLAALGIIPAYAWLTVMSGTLAGLARVAESQAVTNIIKNGALLFGVIVLYAAGADTVSGLLFVQVVSLLLACGVGVYWIFNAIAYESPTSGSVAPPIDTHTRRVWQRTARNFLIMSLTWLFLGRFDVIIVSTLSSTTQAGYFGAAARTAQLANIGTLVWLAWLQPRVSEAAHFERLHRLNRLILAGLSGAVGVAGVLIVTAWFLAPLIMHLMGSGFQAAVVPFRWLLLGYFIWAAGTPFFALLSMTHREALLSRILWMQLLLTFLASFPLVKEYGALGAAAAWSAGMVFAGFGLMIFGCIRLREIGCFAARSG